MKKIIALLLALAMLFALAACSNADDEGGNVSDSGSTNTNSGTEDKDADTQGGSTGDGTIDRSDLGPIKIGHICDLTGTEALTGATAQAAMDFAAEYIGTICGREIEIIHKDSQSSASGAGDAARSLIEDDEVDVIFGPSLIGHKMTVATVCEANETPVIFYNPTPMADTILNNAWVIGAAGSTPQMPTVMADYVYNELGYDKIYILTKNDSGGSAYMDPFVANYEALGGTVLDTKLAPEETTDFTSYLSVFTDPEADALITWFSSSAAIALWNSWYQLGLNETLPIVALFHGAFTDSFICDALSVTNPDLVENMLGTVAPMTWAYDAGDEEVDAFVEAYQALNGGEIPIGNNLSGATVQNMMVLQQAVEALDGVTSDHEALRDALLNVNVVGPEGSTVFENGSNMATKDIFVVQIVQLENGAYNYSLLKKYEDVPVEGLSVD